MRTILALLLLACQAYGGPPLSFGDPSWPNSATTSLLPSGMWLRWRASDLTASPVTNWVDEIQGWTWSQTNASNQPTWSSNGVAFNNTSQFMSTASNILVQIEAPTPTPAQTWLIVSKFNSPGSGFHSLLVHSTGISVFFASDTGRLYDGLGTGPETPSVLFDFLVGYTTTNLASAYTNGISAWTNNVGHSWNDGVLIDRLGAGDNGGFWNLDGTVQEIIVWTNLIFTSQQISNVHHYATNVYGFSP